MDTVETKMVDAMAVRNKSPRTIEAYVRCVRAFCTHYGGRSVRELGADEVEAFMVHLMRERGLAWRTRNQYAGALKFLYGVVLRRPDVRAVIGNAHGPRPLPVVLSHEEVARLLEAFDSAVHRTIALLCYGAGLRVSEACELRAEQVDSERGVMRIEGKGGQEPAGDAEPAASRRAA